MPPPNKRRKQSLFAATLSTRRFSLREDSAAHPTTTSPTTEYREREEVLPSDDDSSIPSDDECPKVTYEEEIDQSHTLNALDKMHHKRHCHFHSTALHRRTYFSMITPAFWAKIKNPVYHLTLPVHQKRTLAQGEVVLHMRRR